MKFAVITREKTFETDVPKCAQELLLTIDPDLRHALETYQSDEFCWRISRSCIFRWRNALRTAWKNTKNKRTRAQIAKFGEKLTGTIHYSAKQHKRPYFGVSV